MRALPRRSALAAFLLAAASSRAEASPLAEPRPISPPGSQAVQVRLAVDRMDNAFLAMVVDGKVRVITLGSALSAQAVLSDIKIPEEEPAIETSPQGVTYAAFAREDNELGAEGREIFLTGNRGGAFGPVLNVSLNKVDDGWPRLALSRSGEPRLAWVQASGAEARIFHYDHARGGPALPAAEGTRPAIAVDLRGHSHLAFSRGEAVLVSDQGVEGFGPAVEIDRAHGGEAPEPRIGVDAQGRLAVAYRKGGEVRLAVRSGGKFEAPRVLDAGLDPDPALEAHLSDGGRLLLAYRKGGEAFVVRGSLDGPLESEQVTRGARLPGTPAVREDSQGNLHLAFIREGRVFYSNSAPPPRADFFTSSLQGELPLRVSFRDLSAGQVRVWRWHFGDGEISSERNPLHTYHRSGRYTVRLEVFGPGGDSRIEKLELITVLPPSNTMEVADAVVLPGQTGVWLPVMGYHREPIQGFQVAGRFDREVIAMRDLSLQWTLSAAYDPEFFAREISLEEGHFTCGLIFDYDPPYDIRMMPPGAGQRLVFLVFDVLPIAPPGDSWIELGHGIGASELGCMYAVDGLSRIPVLFRGRVRVLPASPPRPRLFLRGDSDSNGAVNLTDAIELVGVLFGGGTALPCADAADADDSGALDITDVIYLLAHLFQGGPPLPLPNPAPGLDSTEDALPACLE